MRKITFHVQKSGTGKTILTGSVSCALRRYGKTLMIDGDPQGNLTSWYLNSNELQRELFNVMQGAMTWLKQSSRSGKPGYTWNVCYWRRFERVVRD